MPSVPKRDRCSSGGDEDAFMSPAVMRLPRPEPRPPCRLQDLPVALWEEIMEIVGGDGERRGAGDGGDTGVSAAALRATCAAGVGAYDLLAAGGRVGATVASVREWEPADRARPPVAHVDSAVEAAIRGMLAECQDPVVGFAPLRPQIFQSNNPQPLTFPRRARCLVRVELPTTAVAALSSSTASWRIATPRIAAHHGLWSWACWVANDADQGLSTSAPQELQNELTSAAIFRCRELPHFRFAAAQPRIDRIAAAFLGPHDAPALLTAELHNMPALRSIGKHSLHAAPMLVRVSVHGLPQLAGFEAGFCASCPVLRTVELGDGLGNVRKLGPGFLASNPRLTSLDVSGLTGVTNIASRFVAGCGALREIRGVETLFQSAHLELVGSLCFGYCTSLGPEISLRGATALRQLGGDFALGCESLRVADLSRLPVCINVGTRMFKGCSSLVQLRFEKSHKCLRGRLEGVVLRSPLTGF